MLSSWIFLHRYFLTILLMVTEQLWLLISVMKRYTEWCTLQLYQSSLRTLFQLSLAYLNFTLDSEDLSFWYKRKKWFLWTMAAQAAENHGDEWGLTWYFQLGLYTSISTWTHSQNSAAEAMNLSISSHGIYTSARREK